MNEDKITGEKSNEIVSKLVRTVRDVLSDELKSYPPKVQLLFYSRIMMFLYSSHFGAIMDLGREKTNKLEADDVK